MVTVEIPTNSNCEAADLRVFHDVEVAQPVRRICLEQTPGQAEWYEVTGWSVDGHPCPALARRVDDSGEGLALLVTGGDAGLRLRPAGAQGAWRLDDAQQWGLPFLLLADDGATVAYKEEAHGPTTSFRDRRSLNGHTIFEGISFSVRLRRTQK